MFKLENIRGGTQEKYVSNCGGDTGMSHITGVVHKRFAYLLLRLYITALCILKLVVILSTAHLHIIGVVDGRFGNYWGASHILHSIYLGLYNLQTYKFKGWYPQKICNILLGWYNDVVYY